MTFIDLQGPSRTLTTFKDLQGQKWTLKDLQGPSRTFEDSWVPIISRGSTIGSDMPSALGLVIAMTSQSTIVAGRKEDAELSAQVVRMRRGAGRLEMAAAASLAITLQAKLTKLKIFDQ